MNILSSFNLVHTQDIIFDDVGFQRRYRKNLFVLDDAYLTPLSQILQYLSIQHMDKITHVSVILNVLYLLQVYMPWLDHHPRLSDL